MSTIEKDHFLFSQGDQADAVHYIQTGQIKLTVISKTGKEATVGLLGPGDFVGQDCLVTGQTQRLSNAYALMDTTSLKIEAKTMQRALHEDAAFSDLFASFLLERNMRIHADLVDQLFNSSEKRLARLLLLLAQYGQNDGHTKEVPKISQETLATMIGTTRGRVNFFLNRFRKMGYIHYNGGLKVNSSLLNMVLHE